MSQILWWYAIVQRYYRRSGWNKVDIYESVLRKLVSKPQNWWLAYSSLSNSFLKQALWKSQLYQRIIGRTVCVFTFGLINGNTWKTMDYGIECLICITSISVTKNLILNRSFCSQYNQNLFPSQRTLSIDHSSLKDNFLYTRNISTVYWSILKSHSLREWS